MKKRLVSMILSAVLFATSVPVAAFAEDANTQERLRVRMRGRNLALTIRKMEERLQKVTRLRLITMSR